MIDPAAAGKDTSSLAPVTGEAAAPELEKYLVHLAHLDMPLPAKIELIRAVQQIMQSFVDRAFGDDPVQQVMRDGGKSDAKDASGVPDVVGSSQLSRQPYDLADSFRRHAEKRRRRKIRP